jgi:hypothetical protein
MPFTFSHPAIVLPLKKILGKPLSLTGLVIGSITPDFEYFIRMKIQSNYSHSVLGLFWFDLPLGLLLTFIYHLIVRDQFISNLPKVLNGKLSAFKHFDWLTYFKQNWIIVVVSIFIGAASHILWDDFTHPTGYFVCRIAWLNSEAVIFKIHVRAYNILQQLSSLFGGIIVVLAILSLKNKESDQSHKKSKYWVVVSLITILIFTIRIFTGLNIHRYGDVIVTLISAFLMSLMLTPLLIVRTNIA